MAKQTFTTGQVLTAAQMTSLQQTAMGGGSTTAKTTSYVLVAADAGTTVAMNAAGSTTITVNTSLFSAGDSVFIQNWGAGTCTVTAGTATVTTHGSLALGQWEGGTLYFTSSSAAIFFDISQSTGMTNPMTTTGDTIYSSSGSTPARLGIGSTGQVLTVAGGVPTWATAGGGSGLTYVGGATFSASSAVNLNNVFTSTYANYKMICDYTASSTAALNIRLRVSGADNTTANYIYQQINAGATSVNASRATGQTAWSIPDKDTSGNTVDATIFNPQTSIRTLMSEINVAYSGEFWASSAFGFLATTSFDGLTIYPASGTITGTVRIYGLANS